MSSHDHARRKKNPSPKHRGHTRQPTGAQTEQEIDLELIQRALTEPEGINLSPSTVSALQRTVGNRFVQRLVKQNVKRGSRSQTDDREHVGDTPGDFGYRSTLSTLPISSSPHQLQGYFHHTPGQATLAHFQAQQKIQGSESFLETVQDPQDQNRQYKRPRLRAPGAIPRLRVSSNGNMAIEDTDLTNRQAKVFFATDAIVQESNARLLEIGSPVRLRRDQQQKRVTINNVQHNINNRQLDRVILEYTNTGGEQELVPISVWSDQTAMRLRRLWQM